MLAEDVKFCPRCGERLEIQERMGQERPVCPACDWIFFPDPKVAVAVVVLKDDRILLVKRAFNPFQGLWMLPAGFVDAGEDPERAAVREVKEETNLAVKITELIMVLSGQEYDKGAHIIIVYRAEVKDGQLSAGDDAAQAEYFRLEDLPPLAFESSKEILSAI